MKNLKVSSIIVIVALMLFSCKKAESTSETNDTITEDLNSKIATEEDASSEIIFNNIFDDVMGTDNEIGMAGTGLFGGRVDNQNARETFGIDSFGVIPCLTVTKTRLNPPALFPVKVVMDFETGCTSTNGVVRKGKIITVFTGRIVEPGKKATTTFENYFVDSFKVEGTHITTNTGSLIERSFQVKIEGGKITNTSNGKYRTREALHNIKQTQGLFTAFLPLDDVFEINGSATGTTNRNGNIIEWSRNIITANPIVKKFTCRWFVSGKVNINRTNKPTALLDYGNGNCDNQATVTVNGNTSNIILHH